MSSTSEVGHAKNVANFQDLMAFLTGYGATYNPSKTDLKILGLTTLQTNAQVALADVVSKTTDYNNAVGTRHHAFLNFRTLSTRLVSAIQATDASTEKIKNAKSINRKIQGHRASALPTAPTDPNTPAPTTISTSQQSYDQKIQQLAAFISLLQSEPTYSPNETDLKVATLITLQTSLTNYNNAVANTYTAVSNARITRNKTLYHPTIGLVHITNEIKKYVKSIYGATSPEYAQVNAVKFRTVAK